jgi:hypothetical protein
MRVTNPPQCIRCLSDSLGLSLLHPQANGSAAAMAVESKEGDVASTSSPAPEAMDTTENVPQVSVLGERALISVPASMPFVLPVLLLSRHQCLPAPLRVYALNASPPLPPQLVFPPSLHVL